MKRFALTFVVLALAIRVLVPVGWMPSGERAFALTVCTGVDTQTIWMDSKGGLHKQNPEDHQQSKHAPCAFASANDLPNVGALESVQSSALQTDEIVVVLAKIVSVGRGLAAPPPPQTGPPALI